MLNLYEPHFGPPIKSRLVGYIFSDSGVMIRYERIVTVWNNLECGVIDFSSIKRFKMFLLPSDLTKYVHF